MPETNLRTLRDSWKFRANKRKFKKR